MKKVGIVGTYIGSGLDKTERQWDTYLLAYRGLPFIFGGGGGVVLTDGGK